MNTKQIGSGRIRSRAIETDKQTEPMSVYQDEVMEYMHEKVGDGHNVRHALALTIHKFGEQILTWAKVVVEREVEGDEENNECRDGAGHTYLKYRFTAS